MKSPTIEAASGGPQAIRWICGCSQFSHLVSRGCEFAPVTTGYQTLSSLAERQVTGEFLCVGNNVEIHVFLQAGRMAWATLSTRPMDFVRYLQRHCALDMELFREALAHASQTRAPVGETLVAWKLVSWEDVRNGLRYQMVQAMTALKSLGESQTMFLERKHFSEYNANLTFSLSEIVSASEPALLQPSLAEGGMRRGSVTARQILDATPALAWVELLVKGQSQDLAVKGTRQDQAIAALAVMDTVLQAGADFQAIRSPGGVLIGLRWGDDLTVYSWLPVYAAYGQTVATLFSLRGASGVVQPAARHPGAGGSPWTRGRADSAALEVLGFSDELLAVVALDALDALGASAAGRGALSEDTCLAMCTQIAAALWADLPDVYPESDLQAAGLQLRTLVVRYKNAWCFGSKNPARVGTSIWLLLQTGAPQGLGWACLSALLRDRPLLDALAAPVNP